MFPAQTLRAIRRGVSKKRATAIFDLSLRVGLPPSRSVTSRDPTLDAVGTRSCAIRHGMFKKRATAIFDLSLRVGLPPSSSRRGGWPVPGVKIPRAEPYRPLRLRGEEPSKQTLNLAPFDLSLVLSTFFGHATPDRAGARPYRVQCRVARCDMGLPAHTPHSLSRVSRAPFLSQHPIDLSVDVDFTFGQTIT